MCPFLPNIEIHFFKKNLDINQKAQFKDMLRFYTNSKARLQLFCSRKNSDRTPAILKNCAIGKNTWKKMQAARR